MSSMHDNITGKAKGPIGDLTDDNDREREGTFNQAAGTVKEKLDGGARSWAAYRVDDAKDRANRS